METKGFLVKPGVTVKPVAKDQREGVRAEGLHHGKAGGWDDNRQDDKSRIDAFEGGARIAAGADAAMQPLLQDPAIGGILVEFLVKTG